MFKQRREEDQRVEEGEASAKESQEKDQRETVWWGGKPYPHNAEQQEEMATKEDKEPSETKEERRLRNRWGGDREGR